jgi:uncharacterized protein YbjT (DUF2867 family)
MVGTRHPAGADEERFDLSGVVPDLEGVDTVVHLATQVTARREVAGSEALFEAARRAGVRHLVFMSIVGIDDHPYFYYRAKARIEQALVESGVPWSIFRSTQFHGFVSQLLEPMEPLGFAMLPSGVEIQPVDRSTVANRLVEQVESGPSGRVADIGGPHKVDIRQMAKAHLRAVGKRTPVLPVPLVGRTIAAFRRGQHHTPNIDVDGETFEQYLQSVRKRRDPAAVLLRLSGGLLMLTLVVMLGAPAFFYENWAGFGAVNAHYIRDAATFGVPLAVALWLSAAFRTWRRPVLALGLLQNGLHIINHVVDVAESQPAWHGPVNLVLLVVFELIMWAAWRLDGDLRSVPEVTRAAT